MEPHSRGSYEPRGNASLPSSAANRAILDLGGKTTRRSLHPVPLADFPIPQRFPPRRHGTLKGCASPFLDLSFTAQLAAARYCAFGWSFPRQPAPGRFSEHRRLARLAVAIARLVVCRMGHGRDRPLPAAPMEPLPRRRDDPPLFRSHDPGGNRGVAGRALSELLCGAQCGTAKDFERQESAAV